MTLLGGGYCVGSNHIGVVSLYQWEIWTQRDTHTEERNIKRHRKKTAIYTPRREAWNEVQRTADSFLWVLIPVVLFFLFLF